jgi:hypothetical protein
MAACPTASKTEGSFEARRRKEKGHFHPLGLTLASGMVETKLGDDCRGDSEMSAIGKWMDA